MLKIVFRCYERIPHDVPATRSLPVC